MFVRTKTEPPIYYVPTKPLIDDPTTVEQNKEKVHPMQVKIFITFANSYTLKYKINNL
jgi:hypothetical protein